MSNRQLFTALLVGLLVVGLVFMVLPISHAQDNSLFGYPYETQGGCGSGQIYDAHACRFTLNGDADINSISCLLGDGFNPTSPDDSYIYRFAIYSDNNGKVGTLISQTETGTFKGTVGGSQGAWKTASFDRTIHLSCGKYWLTAVHNASQYIMINYVYPATNYTTLSCPINGMDFPATLNYPTYTPDYVLCIYASGTGQSSVNPPAVNPNSQQVSHISVGCTTDSSSNQIQITGNLSANNAGIASAPILLSYANNPNATWTDIGTITTNTDGVFTSSWSPTSTGSYVINATYTGDSSHTPQTTIANVIVTSTATKSQTVFSVDSNSTVSSLGFNSQTSQLSFSVSGATGTTGYAEIFIAKTLVDDPSKIQASIDGQATNFTLTSTETAWVLYFSYHHSAHEIVFTLNGQTNPNSTSTSPTATPEAPELTLPLILIVLAAAAVVTVVITLKRRQP